MITIAILIGLASFVAYCLFLVLLSSTLKCIHSTNRTVNPGNVWLLFIPLFNFIYPFILFPKISESLKREYESRSIQNSDSFAYELGIAIPIASLVSLIPITFVQVTATLLFYALWIAYWGKIKQYKDELEITKSMENHNNQQFSLNLEGELLDLTQYTSNESNTQKTPIFIVVLGVLSIIGSVLYAIFCGFYYVALKKILESFSPYGQNEYMLKTINPILFVTVIVFFASIITLIGALFFLLRKKIGFYIYVSGEVVTLITVIGLFLINSKGHASIFELIFPLIFSVLNISFIIMYSLNFKKLK